MDKNKGILLSALLLSLFALSAAGDELQITLNGTTQGMPGCCLRVFVSFDLDTLSGTRTNTLLWPNGSLFQFVESNLEVTNFSAVVDGAPFASLPSATGRFAGESLAPGPGPQFFEPGLDVNNVFSWDFASIATINNGTDLVATLLLNHTNGECCGVLVGHYEFSIESANVVDITPARGVPEPATLSLLGLGLVGVGLMRRRKKN